MFTNVLQLKNQFIAGSVAQWVWRFNFHIQNCISSCFAENVFHNAFITMVRDARRVMRPLIAENTIKSYQHNNENWFTKWKFIKSMLHKLQWKISDGTNYHYKVGDIHQEVTAETLLMWGTSWLQYNQLCKTCFGMVSGFLVCRPPDNLSVILKAYITYTALHCTITLQCVTDLHRRMWRQPNYS